MFCKGVLDIIQQDQLPSLDGLTSREMDVLKGICMAQSNKEIAQSLNVSEKTVRNHVSNLFSKLGIQNRQQVLKTYGQIM